MNRFRFYLLLTLSTGFFISVSFGQQPLAANSDSISGYVSFLGGDELQGRATGSAGLEKARDFIIGHLQKWDLSAGGTNAYKQLIPMHGSRALAGSRLVIHLTPGPDRKLNLWDDYILLKSGEQTYTPVPVPIVFVGFGINAPEYDYYDYQNLDVAGKMVVFFDGEPLSRNDPGFFMGPAPTIYSTPEAKIRMALSRGAVGSIFLPNPYQDAKSATRRFAHIRREYATEEISLPGRVTGHLALYLNPRKTDLLLKGTNVTYKQLRQEAMSNRIRPMTLKAQLTFHGKFKRREFKSANILARIEGTDHRLKKTCIIIGAHYDHLGIGVPVQGDSIYNGVLDNAIGSAVLLELARLFKQRGYAARRSILFIWFSGEEKGLLGSRYYVEHPLFPISRTAAMINVDGLALLDRFKSVIAVGGSYSDLGDILNDVLAENGLFLDKIPSAYKETEAFSRSDQMSFASAGIPALSVIDGFMYKSINRNEAIRLNQKWLDERYHTPFDDLSQPMNFDAAAQYTNLIYVLVNRLANMREMPKWKKGTPYILKRMQSKVEHR